MRWSWFAPPTRREITLVLFSITVFIFAYNLDVTLTPHNAVFRKLGLASSSVIGKDGRRPSGWRDRLEDMIFGDWPWDEGHVSGDGAERSVVKGSNRYRAQWLGRGKTGPVGGSIYGDDKASDVINRWGGNVPTTKMVKHVPGYTVFDGLIICNGSMHIVTDDPESFPPVSSILAPHLRSSLKILSHERAAITLGTYGGKIIGVTFLSMDHTPHNSTLLSLWRTYSSLDPSIDSSGRTILPPPRRLIFPRIPVFSDYRRNPDDPDYVRARSPAGFHPFFPKAAFPGLGIMYQEDWHDFQEMEVPFILERAVIADRRAAGSHNPVFAAPFEHLETSIYWLEPIRRALAMYLNLEDELSKKRKKVVTYISSQEGPAGLRLRDGDHRALTDALNKMGRRYGYEINLVSARTPWDEKMTAIVQSTIVLGVHGTHLMDFVFMKPVPQTTLLEFFPVGTFSRDHQILARSIGSRHMAWWNDRTYTGDSLASVNEPGNAGEVVVNAQAVVEAIRESLRR